MSKKYLLFISIVLLINSAYSQTGNWTTITDYDSDISFLSPPNTLMFDTLDTRMYSGEVDTTEAVQVHIFDNAQFDTTDPVFNEALLLENNDTLRAIARLILLTSNSETTAIQEIFVNGNRGLELGIEYNELQSNTTYHSFLRYFLVNGQFISFTWTGTDSRLKSGTTVKPDFFNSIQIQ